MTLQNFLDECEAKARKVQADEHWLPPTGERTASLLVIVYAVYGNAGARRVCHASGFGNGFEVCIGAALLERKKQTLDAISKAIKIVSSMNIGGDCAAKENASEKN